MFSTTWYRPAYCLQDNTLIQYNHLKFSHGRSPIKIFINIYFVTLVQLDDEIHIIHDVKCPVETHLVSMVGCDPQLTCFLFVTMGLLMR